MALMRRKGSPSPGPRLSRICEMPQKATSERANVPNDQSRILMKIDRTLLALMGLRGAAEEVAHSADRPDQCRVSTELFPQVADMYVDRAVERRSPPPVERGRQLISGDNAARGADQKLQDVVFDRRQRDVDAVAPDLARRWDELH